MAIADDVKVDTEASGGDIRYTGSGANYTVLELKTFLGSLLDDAQASGDDLADITTSTIYVRSTDEILTLNSPYNIDDTLAEHLYDGSISQNDGDDLYSGLYVVGTVEDGTEPMILQDNKLLPAYWGTGINPDTAESVIMKIMIKTRSGGADIDNRKVRVIGREYTDKYAEFYVTLGEANSTAAIFTSDDANNQQSAATIEAMTSIVNTEGFQEIDIDGSGASGQEFYSKWDKGTEDLNDVYERTKWVQKRAESADVNAETGDDWIVDDGDTTVEGIGTEFSARDNDQKLVEARFKLKIGGGIPIGDMYAELYDSDDASPAAPTGSLLATSETLDVNRLTSSYSECIFRFNDNVTLISDQEYFIIIRHPDGTVANYIEADGDTTSGDDGNYAYYHTAAWTGVTGDALWFEVYTSPIIHTMAGEIFRGISHEVSYDGEQNGPFVENEKIVWGTRIVFDGEAGNGVSVGDWVKIGASATPTVAKNGGKCIRKSGSDMTIALEDITGSGTGQLADDDRVTVVGSGDADYCLINTTIVDDTKAGGEGILLALDDNGDAGELYIQLLTGKAPVEDIRLETADTTYADATAVINVKTISPEFVGQSTGSNVIGAYGIGFDPTDVGSSDKFEDLSDTPRIPPNNVTITIDGLVSGEDRVLIGPRSGTALNKGLYSLEDTLNSSGQLLVKVNPDIQDETPSSGTGADNTRLRVELDSGIYRLVAYTSWGAVADEFVTASTDWTTPLNATSGNDVFVSYIDVLADGTSESFTAVHSTNRDMILRIRDGGSSPIKTIEQSLVFGSSSQTITITRTSDA